MTNRLRLITVLLMLTVVLGPGLEAQLQQQQTKALTFKETYQVDIIAGLMKGHLKECNNLSRTYPPINDRLAQKQKLDYCDSEVVNITTWCNFNDVNGVGLRFRQSGICQDSSLTNYIEVRNLWSKVK